MSLMAAITTPQCPREAAGEIAGTAARHDDIDQAPRPALPLHREDETDVFRPVLDVRRGGEDVQGGRRGRAAAQQRHRG